VEGDLQFILVEGLGHSFDILLTAGIEVFRAEINFRMDPVLNCKIDPLNEHGVRNVYMDDGHDRIYLDFKFQILDLRLQKGFLNL
jgi:hypothetical protein